MAGPTGTLNIGFKESGPYSTSNRLTESTVWQYVGTASHETFLRITPEGTVARKLAEEWSVDESDTVWSFKLNEGVPFHKGWGEATVDDYIYSANDHVAEGGISWLLGTVKRIFFAEGGGMTKIDDYRFEVDTVTPQFDMLSFGTSVPTTNLTVSKSNLSRRGRALPSSPPLAPAPGNSRTPSRVRIGVSMRWKAITARPSISPNW